MQITLDRVRVDGRRDPLLSPFSVAVAAGSCVLVAAEPGHGHTALALVMTGRLRPAGGAVSLVEAGTLSIAGAGDGAAADGAVTVDTAPGVLRSLSAIVDVPGITDPDDALTVADVVAEGLTDAGLPAWPRDVRRWIDTHGDAQGTTLDRRTRIDQLAGPERTALLLALAAERPGVRFLVLVLPDRHGGTPQATWALAQHYAAQGYGVLVGVTRSTARLLGAELPDARDTDALHAPPVVALVQTCAAPEPAERPERAPSDTVNDHTTDSKDPR